MHEKKQPVDWDALRLDCRTALGRQRWIRAIRCSMSEDQFIAWKARFNQRYPLVDPAADSSRLELEPLLGPALPMCVRNTYSGQIEVLEKFVAPAPITLEHYQQIRRFVGRIPKDPVDENVDDDIEEVIDIDQYNRQCAYAAFKSWHHRLHLAAAEVKKAEKPRTKARRAKT